MSGQLASVNAQETAAFGPLRHCNNFLLCGSQEHDRLVQLTKCKLQAAAFKGSRPRLGIHIFFSYYVFYHARRIDKLQNESSVSCYCSPEKLAFWSNANF